MSCAIHKLFCTRGFTECGSFVPDQVHPQNSAAARGAASVVASLGEWFPGGLAATRAAFQATAAEPLLLGELGKLVHRVSPPSPASGIATKACDIVIYRTALADASDYVKVRSDCPASECALSSALSACAVFFGVRNQHYWTNAMPCLIRDTSNASGFIFI